MFFFNIVSAEKVKELSSNFRVGFGSFDDKNTPPFTGIRRLEYRMDGEGGRAVLFNLAILIFPSLDLLGASQRGATLHTAIAIVWILQLTVLF